MTAAVGRTDICYLLAVCGCYLLLYEFAVATCCCLRIYGCLLFVNLWLLLAVDANLWLLFAAVTNLQLLLAVVCLFANLRLLLAVVCEFAVATCCCLLICDSCLFLFAKLRLLLVLLLLLVAPVSLLICFTNSATVFVICCYDEYKTARTICVRTNVCSSINDCRKASC